MAMRFAACKKKIKALASRLSLTALALAMGLGAAGAVFHPGLLDVMQPKANASGLACEATVDGRMPVARGVTVEPHWLMRQSSSNDAPAERIESLIDQAIHRGVNESVFLPFCNFPH